MSKMFYGKRLKAVRVINGLTVTGLAIKLGLSKQAVSKFETGELMPSPVVVAGIIKLFDLPDNFFSSSKLIITFKGNNIINQRPK